MKPKSMYYVSLPIQQTMMQKATYSILFTLVLSTQSWAFTVLNKTDYVRTYSSIAIKNMKEYSIPASITLAQGILESGSGNSELAKKSNNHFGIKCGSSWNGRKSFHDDDELNECFRAYANVKDSYKDHSLFLHQNTRYSKLFELKLQDYKGWAKELSKAGYATNPKYATLLIELIESLELYMYDSNNSNQFEAPSYFTATNTMKINSINGVNIIVADSDDTYFKISKKFGITLRQLHKYNSTKWNKNLLQEGDIVYIAPKRFRSRKNKYIILSKNSSPLEVSQQEGVKLKSLLRKNHISSPDEQLRKGEKVFLR
jgi:uncharacterized FlgJ-related protein